jgi:hypothetical protein
MPQMKTIDKVSRSARTRNREELNLSTDCSTQTPKDISSVTSIAAQKTKGKVRLHQKITGEISRPHNKSMESLRGVSARQITEKQSFLSNDERIRPRSSSPSNSYPNQNEKSQMVTEATLNRMNRKTISLPSRQTCQVRSNERIQTDLNTSSIF